MWSSCGTTLADWVVSSLCQKSRVIDIPICSWSLECFLCQLINWHFFTAVHLSWNVEHGIELFQPSGFWFVTRNMSHRARRAHCSGEFGPMWRLPKEYLVESELLYGMYMCQPRARDQQSILLKAHWSFDILLIIPSQINQARQAATSRTSCSSVTSDYIKNLGTWCNCLSGRKVIHPKSKQNKANKTLVEKVHKSRW